MADILPPAPIDAQFASHTWTDWYEKVRRIINQDAVPHNDLTGLQGGSTTERYHLTLAQHTAILAALSVSYELPVGSIHISVSPTNPGTTFGYGTWAAFGTGRVLVGVDTSDVDFDTVEETGGSK